jgi:hypothetical protein
MPKPPLKYDPVKAKDVLKMAQLGIPHDKICHKIGLGSVNTLKKLYEKELEQGRIDAEIALSNTAFRVATDPENPNPTMIMFLLKTRFGYRETERKEVDLNVKQKSLQDMSDAELKAELNKYAKSDEE